MLRFASARSDAVNSQTAMRECLDQARERLDGAEIDLLVFHTTIGHDFARLIDGAREAAPGADIAGCTCAGVVGSDGASERMRALAVMAVSGRDYAVAHADVIRGANSFEVASKVAAALKAQQPNISMVNILASGIDIAGDQAIAGIESVFGPETIVFGGTSGDNMRARVCYQFAGSRILERGIVLVGYADPSLSMLTAVHHGSKPIGKPFTVTRSENNHVLEFDGEAAWPALMRRLNLPVETDVSQTLPVAGLGQRIPDDLRKAYCNDYFIHTIFKVSEDLQSFFLPAACPEGTELRLMQRDEDYIFAGVESMIAGLVGQLGERQPVAVFHTDCAARGKFMFNRVLKDEIIARMQYPVCQGRVVPWLGSYGFGEFSPVAGTNRFHTQTSSLYVLTREQ
ncbi:MAG: FIST C-terminal domain-containing protein [Burkholderiales bacterium]|nr:FIST C-terminal domain-containing protein [Burkholderiales bacterium]